MATRVSAVRSTVVLGVASVMAVGLAAGLPASGANPNKTSYYSATADKTTVRYVTDTTQATTVTFTITNCGSASNPPADCSQAKNGSAINSIAISLPSGWAAVSAASLTATGLKLAPGASLSMPVQVLPSASGAGTAQTVTMCVSDTTLCSFQPTGANLTLKLPLKFAFSTSPVTGVPTASLCNTAVQLTDAPAGTDNVPLSGVDVTLSPATGSLDPSLSFTAGAGGNTPTTDATGLATFGCAPNPAVGGPYQVIAVGQNSSGATIPSAASNVFTVYQTLKDCGGNCSDSETGNGGTQLNVTSNANGTLGTSVFDASDGHFPAFTCTGVKKVDGRPDVLQAASNGDKTVIITWSKQVTLKFTDNGTPHWQVCMEAPTDFYTDSGALATANGDFFVGAVPICGSSVIPANTPNPCMQVSRNAAQEIATITLPVAWAGDPLFH